MSDFRLIQMEIHIFKRVWSVYSIVYSLAYSIITWVEVWIQEADAAQDSSLPMDITCLEHIPST